MVCQEELDALRAEFAEVEAENAALRSKVIEAHLEGDEEALTARDQPKSPTAQVAILTREQMVLVAGLRMAEELVALRKSNEVLGRRESQLRQANLLLKQENAMMHENISLKRENMILTGRAQHSLIPAHVGNSSPSALKKEICQDEYASPLLNRGDMQPPLVIAASPLETSSQPAPPKKCSPEEKAERREMVAAVLKSAVDDDKKPFVPMLDMSRTMEARLFSGRPRSSSMEAGSTLFSGTRAGASAASSTRMLTGGRATSTRDRDGSESHTRTGAKIREASHSATDAELHEAKYIRKCAIKDMLLGIKRSTPRLTPRS